MKNWIKLLLPLAIILAGLAVGQKVLQNKQNKPVKTAYLQTIAGVQ